MHLSTKGRYAVTAIMDLALHQDEGPVTLAEISRSQGISLSYLEELFARLRRGRLVQGARGPGGGYRLTRPAERISVAEVILAVDGPAGARGESGRGVGGERCLTHDLWSELSEQIHGFLSGISLAELAQRPELQALTRPRAGAGHDGGGSAEPRP